MAKTYAAFYIKDEKFEEKPIVNKKLHERIKDSLCSAGMKAKGVFQKETYRNIAYNMSITKATELTQLYVTGALTQIILGEPIRHQILLDSLFDTYAPALNATLLQNGFNSLDAMKVAAKGGQLNVAKFVESFSGALSAINTFKNEAIDYSPKYGREIPIDVVTQAIYNYKTEVGQKAYSDGKLFDDYFSQELDPVTITLSANVKNTNAELWSIHDFSRKIVDSMIRKSTITFRFGKSIYTDCLIISYTPTITSIHNINFECKIQFNYVYNELETRDDLKNRVLNRKTLNILDTPLHMLDRPLYIRNLLSPTVDLGTCC